MTISPVLPHTAAAAIRALFCDVPPFLNSRQKGNALEPSDQISHQIWLFPSRHLSDTRIPVGSGECSAH
jgi:hypothetical protein